MLRREERLDSTASGQIGITPALSSFQLSRSRGRSSQSEHVPSEISKRLSTMLLHMGPQTRYQIQYDHLPNKGLDYFEVWNPGWRTDYVHYGVVLERQEPG